ncbi:nucleotidyltransferase substrate binding protein [Pelagibaculum spongiae]|nr:nucleotidyltransferase substrate binding protein [Pelagibaculum spongiae]
MNRCIDTLDKAYGMLQGATTESIEYEMYRSACVKEFEIILEQSGKLLPKCLKDYMHSPKAVDRLVSKEVFRYAAHHDFLTLEQAERWLLYQDNRNNTAHGFESDSGKKFAETTLELLADFIIDARALAVAVDQQRVSE